MPAPASEYRRAPARHPQRGSTAATREPRLGLALCCSKRTQALRTADRRLCSVPRRAASSRRPRCASTRSTGSSSWVAGPGVRRVAPKRAIKRASVRRCGWLAANHRLILAGRRAALMFKTAMVSFILRSLGRRPLPRSQRGVPRLSNRMIRANRARLWQNRACTGSLKIRSRGHPATPALVGRSGRSGHWPAPDRRCKQRHRARMRLRCALYR